MVCSFGGPDLGVNDLGGAQTTYQSGGSTITAEIVADGGVPGMLMGPDYSAPCLALAYDVRAESICGFRTSLGTPEGPSRDVSESSFLVFLVRGAQGGETFNLMLADAASDASGEMISLGPVTDFIVGPVETDWKQARISLTEFPSVDFQHVVALAFDFATPGTGRVEIDQVAFLAAPDVVFESPDQIHTPGPWPPTPDTGMELIDDTQPPAPDPPETHQLDNDARF
jgi:hypothetical protein